MKKVQTEFTQLSSKVCRFFRRNSDVTKVVSVPEFRWVQVSSGFVGAPLRVCVNLSRIMWNQTERKTSKQIWNPTRGLEDKELLSDRLGTCRLIVSVLSQVTKLCSKGSLGNSPAGTWLPSWGPQEPESPPSWISWLGTGGYWPQKEMWISVHSFHQLVLMWVSWRGCDKKESWLLHTSCLMYDI